MYICPSFIHLHRKKCEIIALGILSSEEVCPTLLMYETSAQVYRHMPHINYIIINSPSVLAYAEP